MRKLAGIDAFPLPVDLRDPAEIAEAVALCSSVFAGIHLSDIAAPRCFEVQRLLDERLDIPVFHEDQQGTAAAVLAALTNGLSVAGDAPLATRRWWSPAWARAARPWCGCWSPPAPAT